MTIKSFRNEVMDHIKDYLPQEWQDAEIVPQDYLKANIEVCGITFNKHSDGASGASPCLNMENWYENYLDGYTMDAILTDMAGVVESASIDVPDMDFLHRLYEMTDRIVYEFIHTEQNRDYLKGLPHREFQDLSIIYSWLCDVPSGNACIKITNKLAEEMQLSEEQLFEFAKENTKNIRSYKIQSLGDTVIGMMPEGQEDMLDQLVSNALNTYLVTNRAGCNGAIVILEEEVTDKLYEIFGEDFYLVPSSRHEMLAMPKSFMEVERIGELVSDVNAEHVLLCDRLSNNVYQYDSMTKEITIAYEAPNKVLDRYGDSPAQDWRPEQALR